MQVLELSGITYFEKLLSSTVLLAISRNRDLANELAMWKQ